MLGKYNTAVVDQGGGARSDLPAARHRFTGIDRATVKPSLLVLALAALMSGVLPLVNSKTPYHAPIHRGEVAELATGVTLTPAPGWDLATGALVGHARSLVGDTASAEIVDGAITFDVQAAPFAGTPLALLRRVKQISSELDHARGAASASRQYRVRTRQGALGVGQDFAGVTREGSVVTFVLRPRGQTSAEGIVIVVAGPRGSITRARDAIVAMIRSIRTS
ncbi:MAG TPA: hypothetical protein VKR21_04330 [Solirubrobacteraceae bacterium]|nr:hypothetical protein [Solirubrobacteraceae bacterium]